MVRVAQHANRGFESNKMLQRVRFVSSLLNQLTRRCLLGCLVISTIPPEAPSSRCRARPVTPRHQYVLARVIN